MGSKSMETDYRFQCAVLWRFAGYGDDGLATVQAPEQIQVRWEATDREINLPDRGPVRADILVVVKCDVPMLSIMKLGKLDELTNPPNDLYQVLVFNNTPDIKGRHFRKTALLLRYGDHLPTVTS